MFFFPAIPPLDEITMERVMEEFERCCHENMTHAMETEEGLGIEYDEDVVCDVCQSPDGEDNNEMVFCDKCNICVHQVSRHLPLKWEKNTADRGQVCPPQNIVLNLLMCDMKSNLFSFVSFKLFPV